MMVTDRHKRPSERTTMTEKQPKFCATGASASIDGTQAKNDTATGAKYGHPTLNPSQECFLSNAAKKHIASRHGQPGRGHQSFLIGGRGGRAEDTRQTRSVMTREAIDNHEDTYDQRNRATTSFSSRSQATSECTGSAASISERQTRTIKSSMILPNSS